MARNSAENSAKLARELGIRQIIHGSSGITASGNLVVDRTNTRCNVRNDASLERTGSFACCEETLSDGSHGSAVEPLRRLREHALLLKLDDLAGQPGLIQGLASFA